MSVSDATKHKRHQSPISLLFILKISHCSNVYKTDTSSEVSLKWQDHLIFERLRIALTSISVSGYLEIHRLIEVEKMTIIFFYVFGESYLVPVWMGLAIATLNLPFKQTVEKIFRQHLYASEINLSIWALSKRNAWWYTPLYTILLKAILEILQSS